MLEFVLNFLFPQTCIICGKLNINYVGKNGIYICKKCEIRIDKYKKFGLIDNRKLIIDKLNLKNVNLKQKYYFIGAKKIYWEKMIYCFDYKGFIRKLILQYKFGSKKYLSNFFANQILNNKKLYEFFNLYDIIVPVPVDNIKKHQRGYNQTELIAEIISKTGVIVLDKTILKKVKITKTQSTLNYNERKENIKDAYAIENKKKIYNKNVILFDDIFTTGATVNEISKKLKEAGAKEILILVIAKD